MIINYDRSRVTVSDKELMRHGYAEEDYHSIRLSFEYTEQQKQENRCRSGGQSGREKVHHGWYIPSINVWVWPARGWPSCQIRWKALLDEEVCEKSWVSHVPY